MVHPLHGCNVGVVGIQLPPHAMKTDEILAAVEYGLNDFFEAHPEHLECDHEDGLREIQIQIFAPRGTHQTDEMLSEKGLHRHNT